MKNLLLRRSLFFASVFSFLACAGQTCADSAGDLPSERSEAPSQLNEVPSEGSEVPSELTKDFLDPAGRGPKGRWPDGFPAYTTAADIVTDGTNIGLGSTLKSGTCTNGCVVEHPGDINAYTITRRGTSGEILVRPPLGQRANHNLVGSVFIEANDIVVAGFYAQAESAMVINEGNNGGFAWIEADVGGVIMARGHNGNRTTNGFFCEVVVREHTSAFNDRGGIRANRNGTATFSVIGSWIAGTNPQKGHTDTFQVWYDRGGTGHMTIRDSIVWASYDKVLQGLSSASVFDVFNSYLISPDLTDNLWSGPAKLNFSSPQPYHTTGFATFDGSTLAGGNHGKFPIKVSNSELYRPGAYVDLGGNTVLRSLPAPPPAAPTASELDAIWAP